jgi:hypothetical protein
MRVSLACALVVALALPALAEPKREWTFDDNPEAPTLDYGTPDSDEILIIFSCDPQEKRMTVVESIASKDLKPGGKATFKLTAGSQSLDLTGDAIANESDGTVSIEVNGPPNPKLFALLKAGPSMTIEVAGTKETVPLTGASAHVATFEKLCSGKK